jgi:1,2-phenylacetyl-CoA epoxidase catalytic subunit
LNELFKLVVKVIATKTIAEVDYHVKVAHLTIFVMRAESACERRRLQHASDVGFKVLIVHLTSAKVSEQGVNEKIILWKEDKLESFYGMVSTPSSVRLGGAENMCSGNFVFDEGGEHF